MQAPSPPPASRKGRGRSLRYVVPANYRSVAFSLSSTALPGISAASFSAFSGVSTVLHVLVQVARLRIDIQQAGDDLAGVVPLLHVGQRRDAVVHVVLRLQLPQLQHRAVVLRHHLHRARRVIDGDLRSAVDHVEVVQRLVVVAHEVEALGAAFVVVERDAGRDAVDEGGALVLDRGLDQRHQLRLVAGEAARHEGGAELQGHADEVDGFVGVQHAALALRPLVGGGGELPLGQAVHAVVLDDVQHVHAAPHGMGELADADRGAVAVAGHAQIDQVAVRQVGAGQHRRHAAVHRVEAVRRTEEIGRASWKSSRCRTAWRCGAAAVPARSRRARSRR